LSPDLVGGSDDLVERLYARAGFQRAAEVMYAPPFTFTETDNAPIITDMGTALGPKLGWTATSI
jgi:hypothetical protein